MKFEEMKKVANEEMGRPKDTYEPLTITIFDKVGKGKYSVKYNGKTMVTNLDIPQTVKMVDNLLRNESD